MLGWGLNGMPLSWDRGNLLQIAKEQGIPHSVGKRTYKEAVVEAYPDKSMTEINRLFKTHAIRVYGYECFADEDPAELFGSTFMFAIGRVGKGRIIYFREDVHE